MTRLAPYLFILALTLPFRGVSQHQQQHPAEHPSENGHIAIGLLLPDHSHTNVIGAAELAIERANRAGGYNSREFKLVIRTAEGFWGAGSKESVNLVYEDHVRAIIGSLDGRNGHLAEQVATKSHLTYMETFATEPTLSQAFVPWFMRVVPNDNQQSAAILNQIGREGGGTIGILSTEEYDTRYAVRSLTKAVAQETGMVPLVLDLDSRTIDQREVIEEILSSEIEHLVVPFDADYLEDLIIALREAKPVLRIYGTLHFTMGTENRNTRWDSYENVYMVAPGTKFNKTGNEFRESYKKMFGSLPDSHSVYMYDAVNLVINAIHQAGTNREAITNYLSESEYSRGATGSISFDDLGNRQSVPSLILIKNGVSQLIKSPLKP